MANTDPCQTLAECIITPFPLLQITLKPIQYVATAEASHAEVHTEHSAQQQVGSGGLFLCKSTVLVWMR